MDFVEETGKRQNNYQSNSPGPLSILLISRNNLSRGLRARAETSEHMCTAVFDTASLNFFCGTHTLTVQINPFCEHVGTFLE